MPTSYRDIVAASKMKAEYGNRDGEGKFTSAALYRKNPEAFRDTTVTFHDDGTFTLNDEEPAHDGDAEGHGEHADTGPRD